MRFYIVAILGIFLTACSALQISRNDKLECAIDEKQCPKKFAIVDPFGDESATTRNMLDVQNLAMNSALLLTYEFDEDKKLKTILVYDVASGKPELVLRANSLVRVRKIIENYRDNLGLK